MHYSNIDHILPCMPLHKYQMQTIIIYDNNNYYIKEIPKYAKMAYTDSKTYYILLLMRSFSLAFKAAMAAS